MRAKRTRTLLILAAIVAGLALYPFTPHGRGQVLQRISQALSEAAGGQVQIDGFYLQWPLQVGFDQLTIAGQLEARDADIRLSARALVRRSLHIHWASVEKIHLYNLPPAQSTPETHPPTPRRPPPITLKKMQIAHLRVGTEIIDRLPAPIGTEIKRHVGTEMDIRDGYLSLTHRHGRGQVQLHALVNSLPLSLETHYQGGLYSIVLTNLIAQMAHFSFSGLFSADFYEGQTPNLEGQVRLLVPNLAPIARAYEQDINGKLQADIQLKGQTLNLSAVIQDMTGEWGQTPNGTLAMEVDNLFKNPDIRIELAAQDADRGQVHVRSLSLTAHLSPQGGVGRAELLVREATTGDAVIHSLSLSGAGGPEEWDVRLAGSGELIEPWRLEGRVAVVIREGGLRSARLSEWQALYGELPLHIEEDALLSWQEDGPVELHQLALRIGEGLLRASGMLAAERIQLDAQIQDLPLATFGFAGVPETAGAMEGTFRLHGHPSDPSAELQLQFRDVRPGPRHAWDGPAALFSVTAWLENQRLNSRFLLEGLTGRPVEMELDLPLAISLSPIHLDWPPTAPVRGHLKAETNLGELASLFVLDVHRLSGNCSIQLEISGTAEHPELTGHIHVIDGAYEHEFMGTILRNLQVEMSGERERFNIDRLSASDGDGGTINAHGTLYLYPDADYPFEVALTLNRFRLLRNDTARAIGEGFFQWRGDRQESLLTGELTISPMELRIPERQPAALIDLSITEINGAGISENEAPTPPERQHRLNLHLDAHLPDRGFVRGRGLDSEWSGQLRLRGDLSDPDISGSLSIVRGRFLFFGKRLAITRGIVTLDGSFPPTPFLDVAAESRSGGINAILTLSGNIVAPEIQLSSIPEMPEDEVLARLLFGREAARISPWQAITIAQAVNRLRGGGSAFDVMGETRRILRVDQIEIRESDLNDGETLVSVGKYMSDRVYVELERGIQAEAGRAMVEVELTPSIRLETEIGTNAEGGLGLIWLWDY